MEKEFIAHVGLGYWGKNILRVLAELKCIRSACDSDKAMIADAKRKFPDIRYLSSYDEVLSDPAVSAVTIATPAATHYEFTKKALLAGKDVFVEKPLALTVKEGQELVALASEMERILMVGHILQYHPAVIKLKAMVSSGQLGDIQYIYSNRLNIGKLRTEENILWSFAPHDISVILMLLDDEPEKVLSFGEDYITKGTYDTTLTTMEFRDNVKSHIFVSWLHPYKEQKLIVVGSKAMAVFDDVSEEKLFLYPHRIEWENGKIPVAKKAAYNVIPVEKGEPLKLELMHFMDCVKQRSQPKTDGTEGFKVLRVLELAQRALMCNAGQVVTQNNSLFYKHETAIIDENVSIGEGSKIWHFSHILKDSIIGTNSIIGQNVTIGPDVTIGNKCKIQNNVSIYKGVVLEDEVFCGPSCVFTNVYNPRAFIERKNEFMPTIVKHGATIGANATIVCGVTIGKYAMVGAGTVVKSDVPAYAVVAGVPAKQIGWACRCGVTLRFRRGRASCHDCGNEYLLRDMTITAVKEPI
ncbi:MAG: oxidoreductase [Nitrospirae bacterium]|nr:MAG: oxidoreductase [Nitrospirota bacterium]